MNLAVARIVGSSVVDSEAEDLDNLGRCTLPYARSVEWILWYHSFPGVIALFIAVTVSALCVTRWQLILRLQSLRHLDAGIS